MYVPGMYATKLHGTVNRFINKCLLTMMSFFSQTWTVYVMSLGFNITNVNIQYDINNRKILSIRIHCKY